MGPRHPDAEVPPHPALDGGVRGARPRTRSLCASSRPQPAAASRSRWSGGAARVRPAQRARGSSCTTIKVQNGRIEPVVKPAILQGFRNPAMPPRCSACASSRSGAPRCACRAGSRRSASASWPSPTAKGCSTAATSTSPSSPGSPWSSYCGRTDRGSIAVPLASVIWKCRWGPVERPVEPTAPMTSP